MKKRTRLSFVLLLLFTAISIGGYLWPIEQPDEPVRIHLANNAGPVIFNHDDHIYAFETSCEECHHTLDITDQELSCSPCHPKEYDQHFISGHSTQFKDKNACYACHHLEWEKETSFDHDLHTDVDDCQGCHHDSSIAPEPVACSACHGQDPDLLSNKQAVHDNCMNCHTEKFSEGMQGCSNCHQQKNRETIHLDSPLACETCHEKPYGELVPPRKVAFHGQCMGCHMRVNKGPFRDSGEDKECDKCHLPL